MEICEGVYEIKADGNVYLILNPEPTLIDTGDAVDSLYIKSEIEKIIPVGEIKNVLLTHLHYDHAGNVGLFPNAKFYASEEEIENYKSSSKDFFLYEIPEKTDNILRNKLLPLPDEMFGLEVVRCPGHTRGSVAFLDEKRKLLFSGDTIFMDRIGRVDLPNSVPEKMAGSVAALVRRVRENKLSLCPGHDY